MNIAVTKLHVTVCKTILEPYFCYELTTLLPLQLASLEHRLSYNARWTLRSHIFVEYQKLNLLIALLSTVSSKTN